ncbi:aldehyde dehydrogenase family protein [Micromonospora wenchangensis]|uniref:aldehyde dehydrogenase family protein n=1 Tax=Micromonospora wenchangensis TaxID=1185415 RepID=UPI003D74CA46
MAGIVVEPIVCGRPVRSLDRAPLADVRGDLLGEVGTAPRLMAVGAVTRARRSADGTPVGHDLLLRAADLFATADLDGETPQEYERRVALAAGLPRVTVRNAVADIVRSLTHLPATTRAELPGTRLGDGYDTAWVPAGRLFTAVMASNHPAPNDSWLHALALGYSVLVRPGTREPFTARRLTLALLAAGLAEHRISFLPCERAVGEYLLEAADRGIVYGGSDAVRRWADSATVTTRGPGRSRVLLDRPLTDDVLDHLTVSAAHDGGTRCNNISLVLTTGDPRQVAAALAARFDALASPEVSAPDATLPVVDATRAEGLRRQLASLTGGGAVVHTAAGADPLVRLPDGSHRPLPTVLSTDDVRHPAVGVELPFPFVVVAPWRRTDGAAALGDALVLNLLTDDADLRAAVVADPSVRKVTCGLTLPWDSAPGIPHEGNLSLFLLKSKGVVTTGARDHALA